MLGKKVHGTSTHLENFNYTYIACGMHLHDITMHLCVTFDAYMTNRVVAIEIKIKNILLPN